jgi:hypothetical protein
MALQAAGALPAAHPRPLLEAKPEPAAGGAVEAAALHTQLHAVAAS